MYSQNNEEQVILELFNGAATPGRFLDIGAWDGKTFSNSYRLVELGWAGVLVEPSPTAFTALLALHGGKPHLTLANVALARQPGLIKFYDSGGDAVSTAVEAHVAKWEAHSQVRFKPFHLLAMDLPWFFHEFGGDYDFINLDVESLNWDLFQDLLPLVTPRVKVICVEHDGLDDEMEALAKPLGFTRRLFNGENIILAR
jgi:FkbM family methyltransferase